MKLKKKKTFDWDVNCCIETFLPSFIHIIYMFALVFFKERNMYITLNLFANGIRMQEIQCTLFDDLFPNTRFTCTFDGLAYIKCSLSYTCLYLECTCSKNTTTPKPRLELSLLCRNS